MRFIIILSAYSFNVSLYIIGTNTEISANMVPAKSFSTNIFAAISLFIRIVAEPQPWKIRYDADMIKFTI